MFSFKKYRWLCCYKLLRLSFNTISDIFFKKNTDEPSIGTASVKLPQQIVEDVTIQVVLSEENEQDWISGSLKVYASVKTYQHFHDGFNSNYCKELFYVLKRVHR